MRRLTWLRSIARWPARPHVPFARLVPLAMGSTGASEADRRHVDACPSCAAARDEIARLLDHAQLTQATPAETRAAVAAGRTRLLQAIGAGTAAPSARLLDTAAGSSVAGALAPWLGRAAARALLGHARAGRKARGDVMTAVADPLTAFLGNDAGRALALELCRLTDRAHRDAAGADA